MGNVQWALGAPMEELLIQLWGQDPGGLPEGRDVEAEIWRWNRHGAGRGRMM